MALFECSFTEPTGEGAKKREIVAALATAAIASCISSTSEAEPVCKRLSTSEPITLERGFISARSYCVHLRRISDGAPVAVRLWKNQSGVNSDLITDEKKSDVCFDVGGVWWTIRVGEAEDDVAACYAEDDGAQSEASVRQALKRVR